MRVSNSMTSRAATQALQRNVRLLEDARSRVTTGLRIRRPSDDPVGAARVMEASSELRAMSQYRRNVQSGRARLAAEEAAVDSLADLLTRAIEIATAQASDTADAASRAVAADVTQGMVDSAIGFGNTRFAGTYLFGGAYPDRLPFASDGSYDAALPPIGPHQIVIAPGRMLQTGHDGLTVLVNSDVLASMQQLQAALFANDDAAIDQSILDLERAFDNVQEILGEIGGQALQLDAAESDAEAKRVALTEERAEVEEVGLDEAITELATRETALRAALFAISRVEGTTLTEFLR